MGATGDDSYFHDLYKESKLFRILEAVDDLGISPPDSFPVSEIRRRVGTLNDLRAACSSEEDWTVLKETHNVRTLYKHHSNAQNIHSVRLDGEVEAPVFYVLALLHEVDLFTKWIPTFSFLGINFSRLISHPSPTELLVHLNINVPWPFSNRYCFFHCDGIDCMDEPDTAQIGVILNNLTNESEHGVEDSGVKTTFHAPSGILLTPLSSDKTLVQIVVNLDPQISFIPEWLIDLALRHLAFYILLQIRKAVAIVQEDKEYASAMDKDTHGFYKHIRRRISESMGKKHGDPECIANPPSE